MPPGGGPGGNSNSSIGNNSMHAGRRLANPTVEKMLTGLYKSSNANLHDFRPLVGKLATQQDA